MLKTVFCKSETCQSSKSINAFHPAYGSCKSCVDTNCAIYQAYLKAYEQKRKNSK